MVTCGEQRTDPGIGHSVFDGAYATEGFAIARECRNLSHDLGRLVMGLASLRKYTWNRLVHLEHAEIQLPQFKHNFHIVASLQLQLSNSITFGAQLVFITPEVSSDPMRVQVQV